MSTVDILIIVAYFAIVIGAGFWYRRRAARDLESYFLGGRKIHWTMLAMSGAVSNFDITGTMWMVSMLCVLGMQSWWHHWMWGVAMPAFALAYTARWVRRSRVMTAAEWMSTRFGTGAGGRLARYAAAIMSVIFTATVVGYAFQGIGKFASEYIALDPLANYLPVSVEWLSAHQETILASLFFTVTTLYVVMGGLYSVVLTDVIQTIILTGAAILICWIAFVEVPPEAIAASVPADFTRLAPSWRMEHLAGTDHAMYEMFGLLTIAWVCKGLLLCTGGPSQLYDFQRYVATSSVRDAAKLAAAWPFFLVVRWAMVMGIALLAMTRLEEGVDPERIMPIVLREYLPAGIRGLVLAGLVAAFMSTFSSTVNSGAAFIVRDLWQPIFRPNADESQLVRSSYWATILIVVAGILIGARAESINQIWTWIMMALTTSIIVPSVLRWYWWRLNGWGYAAGVFGGVIATFAMLAVETADYTTFLVICLGSLIPSIVVSYMTPAVDSHTLGEFYREIRPFGFWRPVAMHCEKKRSPSDSVKRSLFNAAIGTAGLTGLYLGPMYLVGHWYAQAAVWAAIFVLCLITLYFTWYRFLPADE